MVSGRNRHATHPVNDMLNYAYAVLEGQVRWELRGYLSVALVKLTESIDVERAWLRHPK
jgi:hypothetical protein